MPALADHSPQAASPGSLVSIRVQVASQRPNSERDATWSVVPPVAGSTWYDTCS